MEAEHQIIDESVDADETSLERLREISELPDVVKVVGLNDLYQGKQETPVSIATATRDTVYIEFSSNVVNCGMSLVRTGLHENQVTDEFISGVCGRMFPRRGEFQPDREDAAEMLRRGAEHVVEEWDCSPEMLDRIENGGSMFDSGTVPDDVTGLVPRWLFHRGGSYDDTPIPSLGGNHFIEFQTVDEVLDEETANAWNVREDEVVVLMHGDYSLTFHMNWHHANRKKFRDEMPWLDRTKMQLSKGFFHLLRDGVRRFPENWRLYDSKERYTGFDVHSEEGRQVTDVVYAAMNFGYANRLLASLYLRDCITGVEPDAEVELVWDVGHDTIQKERMGEEELWIHRKGAAKSVADKPALISGSYDMDSFLGKGLDTGEEFLNSYDHGCSNVIDYYRGTGKLSELESYTKMYSPDGSVKGKVQHTDRKPITEVVRNLSNKGVISEVAWLSPIANIGK